MPVYPVCVSLDGPQIRSGRFGQRVFLPLAEREIQFPSHCTDLATAIKLQLGIVFRVSVLLSLSTL